MSLFQSIVICYWFSKSPTVLWISAFPILVFRAPEIKIFVSISEQYTFMSEILPWPVHLGAPYTSFNPNVPSFWEKI